MTSTSPRGGAVPHVLLLCSVAFYLAARGMSSEATVSLQGDMPRYLMNGVYVHDVMRDAALTDLVPYTQRYFARYPALSLGHHPLLLAVAEAPFFALFGVSVWSGRLAIVCFTLMGIVAWFHVVKILYDREVALMASLLLATMPFVVRFTQVVLSEIPALSMLLATILFFLRYCVHQRRRDAVMFAIAAALSVYAKYHVALLLPVLLVYFVWRCGVRALLSRDTVWAVGILALLLMPLVPITLGFSKSNIAWVRGSSAATRVALPSVLFYIGSLWQQLVTPPTLILAGMGVILGVARRDGRVVLPLLWIVGFYVQMTYLRALDHRYAIFWIPPFCLLAASLVQQAPVGRWRKLAVALLLLVSAYQFGLAAWREPTRAGGYEAAARYVLEQRKGASVLFAGSIDSGYFVFFTRKHDPERRLVVLRADKTIVTSGLARIIRENRTTREQIHELLQDFGTAYVVIEDAPFESPSLELLRQELSGPDFVLRQRIPIETNSMKLAGVDLAIYEYKLRAAPRDDAVLNMRIPLIGKDVAVTMRELQAGE